MYSPNETNLKYYVTVSGGIFKNYKVINVFYYGVSITNSSKTRYRDYTFA